MFDAVDPGRLGPFWAGLLGRDLELLDDGDAVLRGPSPAHTVWINRVPEPRTVKHRIHVDVHAAAVSEATDLGATVIDDTSFGWVVMADPEGGEFCLFVRDEVPPERLYEVMVDAVDHRKAAGWWHEVLGGRLVTDGGVSYLEHVPGMPFEFFGFVEVPEPKTAKNRVHLDIVSADRDGLLTAGATLVRARDAGIGWDVMGRPRGQRVLLFDPCGSTRDRYRPVTGIDP